MTAIPEDVMKAAIEAFDGSPFKGMAVDKGAPASILKIAQGILSERRRCALLARQWKESSFKDEHYAANSIAEQIMAGGK